MQVGTVSSIEQRADCKAVLHLAMNPSQLHLIPGNEQADIASTTVFGAKYVQLVAPDKPSPEKHRPGQTLQGDHVTVEMNTVFQQLTNVLNKIDPAKLNETLGALSSAFSGRGEAMGQSLSDFDAVLKKIEPSLPNLTGDLES
ncbi:MCE family protein, partial [Streptomyces edwardsiae]